MVDFSGKMKSKNHNDLIIRRFLPTFFIMAVIFYMSSQTGDSINLPDINNIDKLCHALEYGTLGATFLYALHPIRNQLAPIKIALITIIFCTMYGVSDEIHQMFVAGRDSSIADIWADFTGALIITTIWLKYSQYEVKKNANIRI